MKSRPWASIACMGCGWGRRRILFLEHGNGFSMKKGCGTFSFLGGFMGKPGLSLIKWCLPSFVVFVKV